MPLIINEFVTEIEPETGPAHDDSADVRPPEGQAGQTVFDLLAIAHEREARLVID